MDGLAVLVTDSAFHKAMVPFGSFLSERFGSDLACIRVTHVVMAEVIDESTSSPTDSIIPMPKPAISMHVRMIHIQAMDITSGTVNGLVQGPIIAISV